jgi:LPXTG-site transpeptidase (sortase) family protein
MDKKYLRILMLVLSGALALTAAIIFYMLWNEGEKAERDAFALLAQSNFSPAQSGEIYSQPDAPEVQAGNGMSTLPGPEIKGCSVIARLDIKKLNLSLPVLSVASTEALKTSVCYYIGPEPGEPGNLVIAGHNYRNGAHFGRLDKLSAGDQVTVTDQIGNCLTYTVYKTELIKPDEFQALQKMTYERELTLMTCELNGNRRLLVRCKI